MRCGRVPADFPCATPGCPVLLSNLLSEHAVEGVRAPMRAGRRQRFRLALQPRRTDRLVLSDVTETQPSPARRSPHVKTDASRHGRKIYAAMRQIVEPPRRRALRRRRGRNRRRFIVILGRLTTHLGPKTHFFQPVPCLS